MKKGIKEFDPGFEGSKPIQIESLSLIQANM